MIKLTEGKTMARTERFLNDGVCCFLTLNSIDNEDVFTKKAEYKYFLYLLKKLKSAYKVKIFAYCLLPTSVQLILQAPDLTNISTFVYHIAHSYRFHFNTKYQLQDEVWDSNVRRRWINDDEELVDLIKYIEFSPIRAELTQSIFNYPYSSCSFRISDKSNELLDKRIDYGDVSIHRSQQASSTSPEVRSRK